MAGLLSNRRGLALCAALLLAAMTAAVWITPTGAAAPDCADARAWPAGPHLSDQNADIRALYFAVHGENACQIWAAEHRQSAKSGLAALGYKVTLPPTPTYEGGPSAGLEAVLQGQHEFTDGQVWTLRHRVSGTAPRAENHALALVQLRGPGGEEFSLWRGPVRGGDVWDLTDVLVIREGELSHDRERHALPPGQWGIYAWGDSDTFWEVFLEQAG